MARADEKRGGGRVRFLGNHVALVVRGARILADLKNLAKGGARFTVGDIGLALGDSLTVIIPSASGSPLKVPAKVARLEANQAAQDVAVTFDALSPPVQVGLQEAVEHIAIATRDGPRANPRLAARMEAEVGSDKEPAVVEDLSRGGLVVRVRETKPAPREKVPVVLRDPASGRRLAMTGRVVYRQAVDDGASRVALKFVSPSREQRDELDRLILSLLR